MALFTAIILPFQVGQGNAFHDIDNAKPWVYSLLGCACLRAVTVTVFGWWSPILRRDPPGRWAGGPSIGRAIMLPPQSTAC